MCSGSIPSSSVMPCCAQEIAHRRIDVLIRAAHVVAACSSASRRASPSPCRRRRSSECVARQTRTADSSMISAGSPRGDHACADAERQRQRRRRRCARTAGRRAPGPEKSGQQLGDRRRASRARRPARRSAASRRRPAPPPCDDARPVQLRAAGDRPGTAARRLRRRTGRSPSADRMRTACRATPASCVSVPPISMPARLPAVHDVRAADA